jgi:Ran GTPase-activating protein (RanGAP) involved in mRNA processing and transport
LNKKDLGIPSSSTREQRFLTILNRSCSEDVFDLRDTGLGENAAGAILRVLSKDTHYKTLNLAGNTIRDKGCKYISELIGVNKTITALDLRSNDIGVEGGCALFEALQKNETVTTLDLSGMSGINRNHIGKPGAEAVSHMLVANRTLRHLSLRENGFGGEGKSS